MSAENLEDGKSRRLKNLTRAGCGRVPGSKNALPTKKEIKKGLQSGDYDPMRKLIAIAESEGNSPRAEAIHWKLLGYFHKPIPEDKDEQGRSLTVTLDLA